MNTPHKASAEDILVETARRLQKRSGPLIISDVVARVEALEAAQPKHPPAPGGSLVEQVAIALARPGNCTWDGMAADVLREVAAWLRYQKDPCANAWAMRIEQEAER